MTTTEKPQWKVLLQHRILQPRSVTPVPGVASQLPELRQRAQGAAKGAMEVSKMSRSRDLQGIEHVVHLALFTTKPILVGGFNLPLWKMMEFVSWDDEIPNMMGKIKNVPNHQPE